MDVVDLIMVLVGIVLVVEVVMSLVVALPILVPTPDPVAALGWLWLQITMICKWSQM